MMKHHKATASDVAEKAGVSKWTVSRAFTPGASISDSARESVLAAAAELGYRPNLLARSLSQKRTHIIGVAIDEMKNPHSMMMLDMVTKQLQTRGYMALLLNITAGENYRAVMAMADQLAGRRHFVPGDGVNQGVGSDRARSASDTAGAGMPQYGKRTH